MQLPRSFKAAVLAACCATLAPVWVAANPAQEPIAKILDQKPFAKEHIALQITDADPAARTTPAGIVRLYELSKAGYFIDRP